MSKVMGLELLEEADGLTDGDKEVRKCIFVAPPGLSLLFLLPVFANVALRCNFVI